MAMTDQAKQKLKYWIIGLFSGCVVATPITALICKNVYEGKIEEAENKGMNEMAAYAVQQQAKEPEQKKSDDHYAEPGTLPKEVPDEEDINNYDVSIDDVEATENARERTEAHERYLDMIDNYNGNRDIQPHIISVEQYENEQYVDKSSVNWYDQDNVFEEELSVIDDPYSTFGVVDGHDLFKDTEFRYDPDVVYVRNERTGTDFEISRIHGSYALMVGGEASLGETNP